jgi:phosphoglycolate phosphatase
VLVDWRRAFANCVNHAPASVGVAARPAVELHPYLGPPLHATFARLAGEAAAEACVTAYRSRYLTHAFAETSVFEGIDEALDMLDEELVVVTSKPAALAEPLLEAVGLPSPTRPVRGTGMSELSAIPAWAPYYE